MDFRWGSLHLIVLGMPGKPTMCLGLGSFEFLGKSTQQLRSTAQVIDQSYQCNGASIKI